MVKNLGVAFLLLCAGVSSGMLVVSPALAALPLGALVLCLWLRNPSAGLAAAVASYPLQRSLLGMTGYAASAAPALLTGMVVLVRRRAVFSIPSFRKNAPQYLAILLFGYTMVSLVVRAAVEQPGATIPNVLETKGPTFYKYTAHALLLYLLLIHLVRSRHALQRLTWILVALLAVLSAIGLQQVIAGDNQLLRSYWGSRSSLSLIAPRFDQATSIFFDTNRFANFLVTIFLIAFPTAAGGRLRSKIVLAPIFLLSVVCLYFCYSVANWFAFLIGLAVWLVLSGRRRAVLALVTGVLVIAMLASNVGLPSMDFLPADVYAKLDALARLDFGPDSALHIRADLIGAGVEMFRANPVFGVGYGGYQPWVAKSRYYMERTKHIVYAHNSYVLVLAELGLLGLAILFALLTAVGVRGLRSIRRASSADLKARQAGLLAAIAANLVFLASYDAILYDLNLWIPLGLTVALSRIVEAERGSAAPRVETGRSVGEL